MFNFHKWFVTLLISFVYILKMLLSDGNREMGDDPNQIHLKLESLKEEFKELKEEIEIIQREIKAKLTEGDDAGALIKLRGDKLHRECELIDEFLRILRFKLISN